MRWEERLREPRFGDLPEFDGYLELCMDYLARQMVVYQNWPQRRFDGRGLLREKVFTDMNA